MNTAIACRWYFSQENSINQCGQLISINKPPKATFRGISWMKNLFIRTGQVSCQNTKDTGLTWGKRSQVVKLTVYLVNIQLYRLTCSFLRWRFTALTVDVDFVLARPACLTVIPTAGLDFPLSSLFAYQNTLGIFSEWDSAIKQESWHFEVTSAELKKPEPCCHSQKLCPGTTFRIAQSEHTKSGKGKENPLSLSAQ